MEADNLLMVDGVPQEGWQKLGSIVKSDEQDIFYEKATFPDSLYVSQEINDQVATLIDFKYIPVKERTPKRYGSGRLVTSLYKEKLLDEYSLPYLITEMEESKIAILQNSMVVPTTLGKRIHYVIKTYAPWLLEDKIMKDYVQGLEMIKDNSLHKSALINSFQEMKDAFKDKIGFVGSVKNNEPEQWLIDKAVAIANLNNQKLSDLVKSNRKLLLNYIAEQDPNIETLGICPQCKKGQVYNAPEAYYCNNSCGFSLPNSDTERFFNATGKHLTRFDTNEIIKVMLKNKKCKVVDFISKASGNKYDAYIVFQYTPQFKSWKITFEQLKKYAKELKQPISTINKEAAKEEEKELEVKQKIKDPTKLNIEEQVDISNEAIVSIDEFQIDYDSYNESFTEDIPMDESLFGAMEEISNESQSMYDDIVDIENNVVNTSEVIQHQNIIPDANENTVVNELSTEAEVAQEIQNNTQEISSDDIANDEKNGVLSYQIDINSPEILQNEKNIKAYSTGGIEEVSDHSKQLLFLNNFKVVSHVVNTHITAVVIGMENNYEIEKIQKHLDFVLYQKEYNENSITIYMADMGRIDRLKLVKKIKEELLEEDVKGIVIYGEVPLEGNLDLVEGDIARSLETSVEQDNTIVKI